MLMHQLTSRIFRNVLVPTGRVGKPGPIFRMRQDHHSLTHQTFCSSFLGHYLWCADV